MNSIEIICNNLFDLVSCDSSVGTAVDCREINSHPLVDGSISDREVIFLSSRQRYSPSIDDQHEVFHILLAISYVFLGISNFLPSYSLLFIPGVIYQQICTEMYCGTLYYITK